MKNKNTKSIRTLLALVLAICLMSCLTVSAFATNDNTAVNDAKNGTLRFNWYHTPSNGNRALYGTGSCFLINENTVVTNAHCVTFMDDIDFYNRGFGSTGDITLEDYMKLYKFEYSVTVTRDISVNATLVQCSTEMDYAILTLDTPIRNKTILPLRDSDTVKATEDVYAIGFPGVLTDIQTTSTSSSEDVTITKGSVVKITRGLNTLTGSCEEVAEFLDIDTKSLGYQECDLILSDCLLSGGNSGGPMVDNNGYVVGVCEGSYSDKYFYTIPINLVTEVCDAIGIDYTVAAADSITPLLPAPTTEAPADPAPAPEPPAVDTAALEEALADAKALDAEAYTETSYKALTAAISDAESALAAASTQQSVDSARDSVNAAISSLEEQKGLSQSTLIIIAAIAVVVVVVVVLAVVAGSKKKVKVAAAAKSSPEPYRPVASSSAPPTSLINGGSLKRVRNGQRFEVNAAEMTVGRDVQNTIAIVDASSISRTHARLSVRGGVTYLKDLASANGTSVNGLKLEPGKEQQLKDGDRLSFADEEFEYHH